MIPFPKIFPRAQTRRSPARWLGREVVPAASHPAWKARLARPGLEPLEGRQVPSVFTVPAINMKPAEQYMLDLINQARANPTAVAQKFGIDLNEGLAAGTISATPKQPLAPNVSLLNAARSHLSDMLSHNFFSHTGSDGSQPSDRINRAGYAASPMIPAEDLAWWGTSGTPNVTQMIDNEFRDLFIDSSWPGRPHRLAMLNDATKEIGPGEAEGLFNPNNPSQLYHSVLVALDFGARDGNSFLTGQVFVDLSSSYNPNGVYRYDIGEEVPGVTVRATNTATGNVYQTTTGMSGGYSLPLPPGTYSVEFTIPPDFLKKLKNAVYWSIPGPWIIGQKNLSSGPVFSGEFF